jgi:hypothetical protein
MESYNLWIDLSIAGTDFHSLYELERIKQFFCLDEDAIKTVKNGSKKPHAGILKDHIFNILLDLAYENIGELDTTAI